MEFLKLFLDLNVCEPGLPMWCRLASSLVTFMCQPADSGLQSHLKQDDYQVTHDMYSLWNTACELTLLFSVWSAVEVTHARHILYHWVIPSSILLIFLVFFKWTAGLKSWILILEQGFCAEMYVFPWKNLGIICKH